MSKENLIFTWKIKKVEDLFIENNFLYSFLNDEEIPLTKSTKKHKVENNTEMEIAYINLGKDLGIHKLAGAIKWYEELWQDKKDLPMWNTNDILTSEEFFINKYKNRFGSDSVIDRYLAVNHTIGNMIVSLENFSIRKGIDAAPNKISIFWDITQKRFPENEQHKRIGETYLNAYDNDWNDLVRNLYFQDFCSMNKNNEYEDVWPDLIFENIDCWNNEKWKAWFNSMTKLIIQRGYRMQLKYKNPKFSTKQKAELREIFEYFGFEDTDVI